MAQVSNLSFLGSNKVLKLDSQHLEILRKLNPLKNSKFNYDTKKWGKLGNNHKAILRDFENNEISRQDIINAYKEYFGNNKNRNVLKPFLLTMVWGYAGAGYGAYRTKTILSKSDSIVKIKNTLNLINKRNDNYVESAFNELKSINGLSVSFISKILYFATRAVVDENFALIFDNRVAQALIKLVTPSEIYSLVTVQRSENVKVYCHYIQLMHATAQENNVEADQIEMFLYEYSTK